MRTLADLEWISRDGRSGQLNPRLLSDVHERRAVRLRALGREDEAREAERLARENRPDRGRRGRDPK